MSIQNEPKQAEQIKLCQVCEYRNPRPFVPNKEKEGWCYMFPEMISRCAQFKRMYETEYTSIGQEEG